MIDWWRHGRGERLTANGSTVSPLMSRLENVTYDTAASGVARIVLDQPDTRNALSEAMVRDLLGAFELARDDEQVRCVVLASTHPTTFSAGGDLAGFTSDDPLIQKHDANGLFPRLFTTNGR